MCYYTGGDDGRDVTFNYRCHDAYGVPQVTQGEHITKYTIDMAGPGGCARVAGLSIGSLTLILSGVAAFVYIAAGIFYNHRYREVPLGVGEVLGCQLPPLHRRPQRVRVLLRDIRAEIGRDIC